MVTLEFTTQQSDDIFRAMPAQEHMRFLSSYDKAILFSKSKHRFIKISLIGLIRQKFINDPFVEFDIKELLDDFDLFFRQNRKRCIRCMDTGYLEDYDELIYDFFKL